MPTSDVVRCFCRRHPLLAVCGRDSKTGEPFVHVKAYRQQRILAEVVATGTVRIRCRECLRWHKIVIRSGDVAIKEEPLPESVVLDTR